jgi:dihydroorotate dehydrogenase
VLAHGLGGIIATNTTTAREGLRSPRQHENGGLSGAPLRERSTEIIRHIHHHAPMLPIIGVGGVFSGDDVWEKLAAGATLVQAYTGFIYRGPAFMRLALAELHSRMEREDVDDYRAIAAPDA